MAWTWSRWSAISATVAILALMVTYRDGVACTVASASTTSRPIELSDLVDQGRARIAALYGAATATPTILLIDSRFAKFAFNANDYGKTVMTPFDTCIVVGAKGFNVDVVAHELVHTEIVHRVGLWQRFLKIPVWFDEGAAMQVDRRPAYDFSRFAGRPAPQMAALSWPYQFFAGSDDQLTFHYASAKHEVGRRFANAGGPAALYPALEKVRQGMDLETALAGASP